MNTYEVDFNYVETVFDSIEVKAEDADEAEIEALKRIKQSFPEADDIQIEMVKELNG